MSQLIEPDRECLRLMTSTRKKALGNVSDTRISSVADGSLMTFGQPPPRSPTVEEMRLVELDRLSEPYWEELIAGEHEPFGSIGAGLVWRDKTRNIGVRADDGRLVAAGGAVLAEVKIEREAPFQVVGLGGLIVTRSARGRGLARLLSQRLLELAGEFEAQRAMLFCLPKLMPLYGELGFVPIQAPVWADQPGGRIEMPLSAMWSALGSDASWPSGRVELAGEPF